MVCSIEKATLSWVFMVCSIEKVILYGWFMVCSIEKATLPWIVYWCAHGEDDFMDGSPCDPKHTHRVILHVHYDDSMSRPFQWYACTDQLPDGMRIGLTSQS